MRRTRAPQNVSAAADWAAAVRSRAATKGWTIEELYRQLEKFTPEEVRQTRDWPKGSTFRSWLRLDHPVPPNPTIARRVADLVGLDPSFSVALTASAEQANATAEVLRVAATQSEIARQLSAAHSQALDTVLSARPSAAVAARVAAHYSGRQDADGTTYACEIRPLARGIKHREIYHDAVLFTPLDDHGAPVDCAHLREHTPDAAEHRAAIDRMLGPIAPEAMWEESSYLLDVLQPRARGLVLLCPVLKRPTMPAFASHGSTRPSILVLGAHYSGSVDIAAFLARELGMGYAPIDDIARSVASTSVTRMGWNSAAHHHAAAATHAYLLQSPQASITKGHCIAFNNPEPALAALDVIEREHLGPIIGLEMSPHFHVYAAAQLLAFRERERGSAEDRSHHFTWLLVRQVVLQEVLLTAARRIATRADRNVQIMQVDLPKSGPEWIGYSWDRVNDAVTLAEAIAKRACEAIAAAPHEPGAQSLVTDLLADAGECASVGFPDAVNSCFDVYIDLAGNLLTETTLLVAPTRLRPIITH